MNTDVFTILSYRPKVVILLGFKLPFSQAQSMLWTTGRIPFGRKTRYSYMAASIAYECPAAGPEGTAQKVGQVGSAIESLFAASRAHSLPVYQLASAGHRICMLSLDLVYLRLKEADGRPPDEIGRPWRQVPEQATIECFYIEDLLAN